MTPIGVRVVARRMLFVEFHVADESGAGMTRFQQVMTQDLVLREASVHGSLEGIHLVNPFSNERAFLENILIHVGNRPRVRINARVAREQPDEPGSSGARQTHAHPRLQNAVAFGNNSAHGIEPRPVQRMRQRSDKLTGGIARQLGVGVERDDIFDGGQNCGLADDLGKAFPTTAAEKGVKFRELSALAFVTHPQAFSGVPAARAMKQEKKVVRSFVALSPLQTSPLTR